MRFDEANVLNFRTVILLLLLLQRYCRRREKLRIMQSLSPQVHQRVSWRCRRPSTLCNRRKMLLLHSTRHRYTLQFYIISILKLHQLICSLHIISEIISTEASIIILCNISPSCEITSSWAACVQSRKHAWGRWSGRWRAMSRRKRIAGGCWRMFSQTRPLLAVLSPRTVHWRTSWLSYRTVSSNWWGWRAFCSVDRDFTN